MRPLAIVRQSLAQSPRLDLRQLSSVRSQFTGMTVSDMGGSGTRFESRYAYFSSIP